MDLLRGLREAGVQLTPEEAVPQLGGGPLPSAAPTPAPTPAPAPKGAGWKPAPGLPGVHIRRKAR